MMDVQGLWARHARMEQLSRGLAKEVVVIKDAEDPLLYLERKAYLNALQDTLAGVESARVVLARALHRLDGREAA
jgi:hypothetical protein